MNKMTNEIVDDIIQQFNTIVKDDENEKELQEGFRNYLNRSLKVITDSDLPFAKENDQNNQIIEKYLRKIAEHIINSSVEYKKIVLIDDYYMNKLNAISKKIYEIAMSILEGKKEETKKIDTNKLKEELRDLLKKVKPWNYAQAEQMVSETILDLGVIENPSTDVLSLRLGHIYGSITDNRKNNNKTNNKEEEER